MFYFNLLTYLLTLLTTILYYTILHYTTLHYTTLHYNKKNDIEKNKKPTNKRRIDKIVFKTDDKRLEQIIQQTHEDQLHTNTGTFKLDYTILHTYYHEYAEAIITDPEIEIQVLQLKLQQLTIQPIDKIQIHNIPPTPIRQIHSDKQGQIVSFEGNVKKTRTVYNQLTKAVWNCKKCTREVPINLGYDSKVTEPKLKCPHCKSKKGYTLNKSRSTFKDVQLFTVQERLEEVRRGFQPVSIQCYLENELIQTCKPGDKIQVTGRIDLRNDNKKNRFYEYCIVDDIHFLERNFEDVEISSNDKQEILELSKSDTINRLSKSIVPSLQGFEMIKKALLLQLASSDMITNADGSTQRGDIHILLIGDPGIGKSKLLQGVSQLAPRGVFTSGKSSSGAGLTAAAVKDKEDTWTLEAGAMVLADGGQVCIDEFDKMNENDRSAIHEALEQQTISIAKAGMNTTLHSQCSVLAAANPKHGNFRDDKDAADQINLTTPLMSRFDLIFILRDIVDNDNDLQLAERILSTEMQVEEEGDDCLDTDFIRKYISYARRNIHPVITVDASRMISEFYGKWRQHTQLQQSQANTRQLFALIRLSKASARIRLSDTVTSEDVQLAIDIETACINSGGDIELTDDGGIINVTDAQNARLEERMKEEIKRLKEDYGDTIPNHILFKKLKHVTGRDKSYVNKFLSEEDQNGKLVYDTSDDCWSVR